jgi:YHS domain-containing protein
LVWLLRILVFLLGVFWILKKVIGFLYINPIKSTRSEPEPAAPTNTVKDPVCGMYMDPRLAIRHQGKTGDLYFCSEDCRDRYLDASKD